MDGCTYSHLVGLVDDRDKWFEEWRKKGIQLGQLIEYVIPKMPAYKSYDAGHYPVAESYSYRTINFPIHGN